MGISNEFKKRVKELTDEMAEINKTQRAKAIGIEPTTFSNVYNYGIIPKTPTLIKIADYFNVSIEYLMGLTDNDYFEKSKGGIVFWERLEELRKEKEISTVYKLSQEILIHKNNIAQWYKIKCLPLIDDLLIIAKYFNVSVDYLLGRTDDRISYV